MKSNPELTPVERLLNVCSLCRSPPIIMQMPCEQEEAQRLIHTATPELVLTSTVMCNWCGYFTLFLFEWNENEENFEYWTIFHVTCSKMWHKCRLAHRDEKDASEQRARQCWFNDLLQTWVRCLVASEQGGDVKRQLCDGAKAGVHHCSHSKVTLGWDTAGANMSDN